MRKKHMDVQAHMCERLWGLIIVPLNVIISTDKCLADPVIGPVFSEHKDIFTDEHNDWEQLLLTVFIMY